MNFLQPHNIGKINSIDYLLDTNLFRHFINDISSLDREWRLLRNNASIVQLYDLDAMKFWQEMGKLQRGDNTPYFPNLNHLVSIVFTLPHSSASVERVFSQINLNKTKIRNRLNTDTLNAILHTKNLISSKDGICDDYTITSDLISKHNNNMYKKD